MEDYLKEFLMQADQKKKLFESEIAFELGRLCLEGVRARVEIEALRAELSAAKSGPPAPAPQPRRSEGDA